MQLLIPEQFRGKVAEQQIDYVYKTINTQLIANPAAGLLVVWLLYGIYPTAHIATWFIALSLVMVSRWMLWKRYWATRPSNKSSRPWGINFTLTNVFNGLAWGSLVFIFFSQNHLVESMVLIIVVAGFTAGSFSSHSAYLPSYIAFSSSAIGLVVLRLLWEDGKAFEIIIGLCVIYYITLVSYARTAQDQVKAAIVARLQIEDLNKDLEAQKAELNIAKDAAEQANLAKSKFLGSASHDLRQPLHALRLYTDVLSARPHDTEQRTIIRNISTTLEGLEELFSNLLELARVEANAIKPNIKVWRLQELFDRLFIENEPVAKNKGLKLRIRPAHSMILADPVLVERILRNLITNAICYTKQGSVLVGARVHNDLVRIEVWDTGIGIAQEQVRWIFGEFHQVGNPERDRTKGFGLGLAISQKLAHIIGTNIEVKTRLERGSCFSITVPLGESGNDIAQPAAEMIQPHDKTLNGIRVVFADDDAEIRQAMQAMLADWGCQAVVGDGLEAVLAQLDSTKFVPGIIITDYRLRDNRTGAEVINTLRAKFSATLPAIIVTGDTHIENAPDATETGARILHKPLKPARLRILMEQLVNQRKPAPPGSPGTNC